MGCSIAIITDKYSNGWMCPITNNICVWKTPDSKSCAILYNKGPKKGQVKRPKRCRHNKYSKYVPK